MKEKEFNIISKADGLKISCIIVQPDCEPWAVLQLAHGICGCKERFLPFMYHMAQNGVLCVANDHRGHGESVRFNQDLGYMYGVGYKVLVAEMKALTDYIRRGFPDIPVWLLGHSMGALAASVYAHNWSRGLSGLILCGFPYTPLSFPAAAICRLLSAAGLGRMRLPGIQTMASNILNRDFASEGYQAWVCSDTEARDDFRNDPSCNFILTSDAAGTLMSLMSASVSSFRWRQPDLEMPVFLLSGEDDPCAAHGRSPAKCAELFKRKGFKTVTRKEYPAMRHEILNETAKEHVWDDILMAMAAKSLS